MSALDIKTVFFENGSLNVDQLKKFDAMMKAKLMPSEQEVPQDGAVFALENLKNTIELIKKFS